MITISEIKKKSENFYSDYLKSLLTGQSFFPKIVRSDKNLSANFNEMRNELADIIKDSKDRKSFGYTIKYKEVNTRKHGVQSLPDEISFQSELDYLKFLDKEKEVECFKGDSKKILENFPELIKWLKSYPKRVIEYKGCWQEFLSVCKYFKLNPKPNLYIRELPVGVHTKYIEKNKGILFELLNEILPAECINPEFTSVKNFERRFGLKFSQNQIRIRILDKMVSDKFLCGLTDIVVTEEELINLRIPCERVFILENKTNFSNLMNFLTLPQMENTIGIFGSGFKIANLKKVTWLDNKKLFYWGDIDTHGFQILSQLRGYFRHANSIMMDFETLEAFKKEWDRGEPITVETLSHLTNEEKELFLLVRADNINTIRLEQEKITQEYVVEQIKKLG